MKIHVLEYYYVYIVFLMHIGENNKKCMDVSSGEGYLGKPCGV